MAARQNRIEKQRVNIGFKIPAVHLDAKFIAKHQRNGQRIMLIIIGLLPFSVDNNLLKTDKILIWDGKGNIGNHLDTLGDKLPPARTPDRSAVITFISGYDTMDSRECFAFAEQSCICHQFAGMEQIFFVM